MQFLSHNREKNEHALLAEKINDLFVSDTILMGQGEHNFGKVAYDTESSNKIDFKFQCDTADSIEAKLKEVGLEAFLRAQTGVTANSPQADIELADRNVQRGMQAAVATAVALIDADEYHDAYCNAMPSKKGVDHVIEGVVPGQATAYQYDTEGYDNFKFEKFRATSIVSNAMNAMTNSFEDTWFKPIMISPAEQGADVSIRIPQVFNSKTRNLDGSKFKHEKRRVIDAYRDRTVLANTGNKVWPNVTVNGGAELVDATLVDNIQVTSNSTTYNTRPIKVNEGIDILSYSRHAGLPDGEHQNESDTLFPTAMLGDLYVRVTYGDTSGTHAAGTFKIDTTPLQGSLFVPGTVGDTQELVLALRNVIKIDNNAVAVKGDSLKDMADLWTDLSGANTDDLELFFDINLSGSLMPRDGDIEVNTAGDNGGIGLNVVKHAGAEVTGATLTTVTGANKLAFEILGYMPKLSRTNSNLRDKGMAVDLGSTTKYRLAVPLLSPITASQPTGVEGGAVGMDGLQMVNRIRKNNIAVQTLLDYTDVIRSCNGVKTQHAGIGSELITPTIVEDNLPLETKVMFLRSKGARDDVREAIAAALDQMASQMLEDSGYLATLDALYGTQSGFEFIIVTSPRLHSLLMTSGDARLLGSNRSYTIVSNHDDEFINKIYMSIRRPGSTGVDPLSFGAHVSLPPLVYRAPVTVRKSEHSIETQLLARDLYVGTCPMVSVLTVGDINGLFTGTNQLDNG